MRKQQRKNRPDYLCKRGGSSGSDDTDGGGKKKRGYVKSELDNIADRKVLAPEMDLLDVFDDLEVIAPNLKVQEANNLIRQALNLGPNKEIPEMVTNTQAAQIVRMIALKSRFNIRNSDLKHYLDY